MMDNQNSGIPPLSGESVGSVKKTRRASNTPRGDKVIIDSLIEEALRQHPHLMRERKYREDCAQAVIDVLSEFLSSYILIGYDFSGTPIRIVSAKNGMEADAIANALQRYIAMSQFGDMGDRNV